MGVTYEATCNDCQAEFEACYGGGMDFELWRCDTCGQDEFVPFGPPPTLWQRLIRRLGFAKSARKCRCGGKFTADAPTRCPVCRSPRFTMGRVVENYD